MADDSLPGRMRSAAAVLLRALSGRQLELASRPFGRLGPGPL